MKRSMFGLVSAVLLTLVVACNKKEETPAPVAPVAETPAVVTPAPAETPAPASK